MGRPTLVVHGGAGAPLVEEYAERQAAVERALVTGWARIAEGALAAVVAAVRHMEDEPILNAGVGACFNRAGDVELDAAVMEGTDLRVGALGAVRDIRHPVDAALRLMVDGRHVLLVAEGASQWARESRVEMCSNEVFKTDRQRRDWETLLASSRGGDTVGAVAVDDGGHTAVAVSTGGMTGKLPGRIGDSPVPGAGFYANDRAGAVCATGRGEGFLRTALCHLATVELQHGMAAQEVADGAISYLARRVDGSGGVILVTKEGAVAAAMNTPFMAWASRSDA
jgi:beta-aspartyl-peptidase (threonine type)